jgi:hypothetical protein
MKIFSRYEQAIGLVKMKGLISKWVKGRGLLNPSELPGANECL